MIVHIGLGKTGTTSLQKTVFPELRKLGLVTEYNPPDVMRALRRYVITGYGMDELRELIAELPSETIISLESLAGWNPARWIENAVDYEAIFPSESTILLTLRDPESYLTSVYVQMLQEGNVVRPESFFIENYAYEFVQRVSRPDLCGIFKVDDLDYERLIDTYQKYFKRVLVVPVSALSTLNFLKPALAISDDLLEELRSVFLQSKRENISYSKLSVNLTLARERMLLRMGLRTRSSHDRFFVRYAPGARLSGPDERRSFFEKVLGRLGRWISWRNMMQNIVDKVFKHKKYNLPTTSPRGASFSKNEEFYQKLKANDDGYVSLDRK